MDWLQKIGLNEKQQKLYFYLLENGALTASQLSEKLQEQRTNIYLITDELEQLGLVERNNDQPVVRFAATNPSRLQQIITKKQQDLATSAGQLKKALPELQGKYVISSHKPGFAYYEGLKGYGMALDDMIRSNQEVCVFGSSNVSRARPDAWILLQEKLQKRALSKINTRIIFEKSLEHSTDIKSRQKQRMQVRFWGDSIYEGEVAVYGHTVIMTTYDDKLISLVIKNILIATTLQAIFDTAWTNAKKPIEA